MPTFEIPDGPTSVDVPRPSDPKSTAPAEAAAVYNVTNKSSESASGSLVVELTEPAKLAWFTIDGEQVRNFGPGETQTANVKIKIPADVAPGEYKFQLLAAATSDTDNDVAKGPMTTAVLKGAEVKKKSLWWLWLLLGLLALAIIGGVVWYLLSQDKAPPTPTATVPPLVDKEVDKVADNEGGFVIVKTETPNTGRKPKIIWDQDPDAGSPLEPGKKVTVSYEPGIAVPVLPPNATFTSAPNVLRGAGLEPGSFLCDPSSGSRGANIGSVTAFSPDPGTVLAAKSPVHMRAVQATRCRGRFIDVRRRGDVAVVFGRTQ